MEKNIFEKLVSFLKDKGFIYQSSIIYGGLANLWDYGPLGSLVKENVRKQWLDYFVYSQENAFLVDTSILTKEETLKSSGHLEKFNDILLECKTCKKRYRIDQFIPNFENIISSKNFENIQKILISENILCPNCKSKTEWSPLREFNLMLKTTLSKTNNNEHAYLRPETAQGIFLNFKNIVSTFSPKLPFSIAQIGKAFRNEINPGYLVYRTKEFEQMELEIFCSKKDVLDIFEKLRVKILNFLLLIGLKRMDIVEFLVPSEKLAHYSKKTIDFQYKFPFGTNELLGLAYREDFDLKNHSISSKEKLVFKKNSDLNVVEEFTPHVIEVSFGLDRLLLAIFCNAFINETLDSNHFVFRLAKQIAPYKLTIASLAKNFDENAKSLYNDLVKKNVFPIKLDLSGSIGKKYYRSDSIGIPYVITIDNNYSLGKVTIRNNINFSQETIDIMNIENYIVNAK